MLNINDLTKRKREREKKRIENYNHVLEKCHNKIIAKSNSLSGEEYLFYTIPNIIFGQPLINIEECSMYIIDKLVKNGFIVKYLGKGFIFISWCQIIKKEKKKIMPPPKKKVSFNENNIISNKKQNYRSINDIPSTEKFININF